MSRVVFFILILFSSQFSISRAGINLPNILVILADDLGYGDVGFTGSKEIHTPRLDDLALNGVICNNGYVTHPYCGPSRAGLITGRYQARFGMEINCSYSPYDLKMGLPLSEKTFANHLKEFGYRTGIIGKWHLGAAPPFHPNNRGFDYFYGFLSGGHTYFPSGVTSTHPLLQENGLPHYTANEGCFLPLVRNDNTAEFNQYLTRELSQDAVRFVNESEEPFCLYISYNAPHTPLEAPEETIAEYQHIDDWNRRVYAAMIDEMDQGIGSIIDALEESGKFDNTLIIFLSDNGGVAPKPGHESENWANNKPFTGGKGSFLEGGIHVPFIIHWRDGLNSGIIYDGLISALDITPTLISVAGGNLENYDFDGVNIIPFIKGNNTDSPHEALFWRESEGACWAIRTVNTKFLKREWNDSTLEMYDMHSDPFEKINMMGKLKDMNDLAELWNTWNEENKPNILLQSYDYQLNRQKMYKELYNNEKKKSFSRKPMRIEKKELDINQ